MRVSPLDIRKQTFKKVMRGADLEEVRMFLDVVASEFEKVIQDNAMMAERIRTLDARVAEFRALEENMRNSLVMADRIATEARESSEREARRLVQDAHSRAERILEDARERLQILVREIESLRGKKDVYARRFWTLIEGQIAVLQEHMSDTVEVESLRQRVAQLVNDARAAAESAAEEPAPRPARDEGQDLQAAPPLRASSVRPETVLRSEVAAPGAEAGTRPGDTLARPPVPRGLGRLLRGRQIDLPMNGPSPAAGSGPPRPVLDDTDALEPERAEGYFELSASDARRREGGPRFGEDTATDRG